MPQKKGVKQGFPRVRLVFFVLVFFAINALLLGWSGFSSDSVQWVVILGMDSFFLVSGLLMVFLWRRIALEHVKGELLEAELEMATVMVERLNKYVGDGERGNNGL